MADLNDLLDSSGSGWTLQYAQSINDMGWIVGGGFFDESGSGSASGTQAFLLIPVPEPSCPILACVALGILASTLRATNARKIMTKQTDDLG